jgi:hypothetical protein
LANMADRKLVMVDGLFEKNAGWIDLNTIKSTQS